MRLRTAATLPPLTPPGFSRQGAEAGAVGPRQASGGRELAVPAGSSGWTRGISRTMCLGPRWADHLASGVGKVTRWFGPEAAVFQMLACLLLALG